MQPTIKQDFHRNDHLANERTFLAWMRTNLGVMAFGFVLERFSFFIQQVIDVLGKSEATKSPSNLQKDASLFGMSLVGLGALLCLFAFIKFRHTKKQIEDETYHSSILLETLIMLLILGVGAFLIVYLVKSSSLFS